MTPEQQKEFIGAIEARITWYSKCMDSCEFWTDGWHEGYNKIKVLRWVLDQFNQIKNK